MSDFENNIYNLFNDYNEKPSNNVWQNIQEYLFVEKIKNHVKDIRTLPSKYLWYRIAFKLQLLHFFRFSLKRVNFYTTSLFIILSFYVYKRFSSNNFFTTDKNIKNPNNIENIFFYNSRNTINQSASEIREEKEINNKGINTYNSFTVIKEDENNNTISDKSIKTLSVKDVYFIENYMPDVSLFSNYELKSFKYFNSYVYLNLYTGINNLTLVNYSEADVKLCTQNSIIYPSVFLGIEKQLFNFSFQTGLNISKYYCNLNHYDKRVRYEQNFIYNLTPHDVYSYNYYQILNIDSLIATGDTVLITVIDSTYLYTVYDTAVTINNTEKQYYNEIKNRFDITSFKIPLLSQYYIPFGLLSLGIKGGFSFSYFSLKNIDKSNGQKNIQINFLTGIDINFLINSKNTIFSGINYETRLFTKNYGRNYFEFARNNFNFVIGIKHKIR